MSRRIRERVSVPVFLAGGLSARNVRAAVDIVRPYGVDLCSGVRTNGSLDESKLRAFMRESPRGSRGANEAPTRPASQ